MRNSHRLHVLVQLVLSKCHLNFYISQLVSLSWSSLPAFDPLDLVPPRNGLHGPLFHLFLVYLIVILHGHHEEEHIDHEPDQDDCEKKKASIKILSTVLPHHLFQLTSHCEVVGRQGVDDESVWDQLEDEDGEVELLHQAEEEVAPEALSAA